MYSEASLVLCPRNFLRCCVPGTLIGHSCSKTLNGKYVVIALRISATRRSHVSQHADVNAQAHVAPWKVHQLPFDLRVTIAGCWATAVRGQASCLVGSVTGACQVAQVAPLWKPVFRIMPDRWLCQTLQKHRWPPASCHFVAIRGCHTDQSRIGVFQACQK